MDNKELIEGLRRYHDALRTGDPDRQLREDYELEVIDTAAYRIADLEEQLAECQRERDALREAMQYIADECEIKFIFASDVAKEALAATKEK